MVKIKFKRKPVKAKKLVFGNKHTKPVRRIVLRSTSIFSPLSFNKPVKSYWGDYDGDGVINGLDCQPRNKYKQGPQHKRKGNWNLKIASEFREKFNAKLIKEGKIGYTPEEWEDAGGKYDEDLPKAEREMLEREDEERMEREAHKHGKD